MLKNICLLGGPGVYRGYNSLKSICEDAELQQGHKITSITLRKYMATMTQVSIDMVGLKLFEIFIYRVSSFTHMEVIYRELARS